jgi:hypothetical protein
MAYKGQRGFNLKTRLVVIALLLCGLLLGEVLRPVPVHANSTTDTLLLAVGVTAGYVGLVVVGTVAAHHNRPLGFVAVPPPPPPRRRRREQRVHFALGCAPRSGHLTLVCW